MIFLTSIASAACSGSCSCTCSKCKTDSCTCSACTDSCPLTKCSYGSSSSSGATCPVSKTCSTCKPATCSTCKTPTSYGTGKTCTTCVTPNFGATTAGSKYAVKFRDTSACKPVAWSWNFGDGSRSSVQNPEHKYAKAGSYRVYLSIKVGSKWCPTTVSKTVIVK
jgi:PKD repeat protein